MMKQYVVDAFTAQPFSGNPAAVCVMERWPSDGFMTKMAMENNLSETAFIVREGDQYHLRWFTPGGEIDLCGHATLASKRGGILYCRQEGTHIKMAGEAVLFSIDEVYATE